MQEIKKILIILALWTLAIVCNDIMNTIIFHPDNMIFSGTFFAYPTEFTFIYADAWHLAKICMQGLFFICILVALNAMWKMILVLTAIFIGVTWLTHNLFFHYLFIK